MNGPSVIRDSDNAVVYNSILHTFVIFGFSKKEIAQCPIGKKLEHFKDRNVQKKRNEDKL